MSIVYLKKFVLNIFEKFVSNIYIYNIWSL